MKEIEEIRNKTRLQLTSLGYSDAEIPLIESEGASLPLGGLFDYKNTWTEPHCTHRDGKTIDISFSSFDNLPMPKQRIKFVKNEFLRTMNKNGFKKNNEDKNHWHFYN